MGQGEILKIIEKNNGWISTSKICSKLRTYSKGPILRSLRQLTKHKYIERRWCRHNGKRQYEYKAVVTTKLIHNI